MLLENKGSIDTIKEICSRIKDYMDAEDYTFDETVDGINFWCVDDIEKTVFMETKDGGYATIVKDYLNDMDACVEAVAYQLNGTEEQEDEPD